MITPDISGRRIRRACSSLALVWGLSALSLPAAVINVSNSSQLNTALASVNPGDEVVLANGTYSGFSLTRDGTASAPIVVRAANRGGANVNAGIIRFNRTSYVTVEGLLITTAGSSQTVDEETFKVAVWFDYADHCRLTRCTLRLSGHTGETEWVMLGGASQFNRIDHCEFGPNSVDSHLIWPRGQRRIPGVTPPSDRTQWALGNGPVNPNFARDTRIDHNYFHDHMTTTNDGAESIVLGGMGMTGDYQDQRTIVEYNLWDNVFGDGELISVKTSGCTLRYNTIRRSGGGFTLRSGNNTKVHGNFFMQAGRQSSGAIRIHERDHQIYNNYVENTTGDPLIVGYGDPYGGPGSFSHAQVVNARIMHNTFVNCGGSLKIGTAHPLTPANLVVANNLLSGTNFSGPSPQSDWTYTQNIVWPTNPNRTGFLNVNPLMASSNGLQRPGAGSPALNAANPSFYPSVTDDIDGHLRDDPDIGADEVAPGASLRRPLTVADVGPNAPDDSQPSPVAAPVFTPLGGVYSSCQTVTITTSTVGATLRYTTDGSTPSATSGNVYVGPITVCTTSTLRAIAFKSGSPDSAVATATYTINSGPGTLDFEAEALVRTASGATAALQTDANASGGQWVLLSGDGAGDFIEYTLPNVPAGTYSLRLAFKTNNNRAIVQASLGGASVGAAFDQYAPTPSTYPVRTLGNVTVSITGNVVLRLAAVSKNASSSSYSISADRISLLPASNPSPTVAFEGETLAATPSGATTSTANDAAASGGVWRALNSDGVGDFLDLVTPSIAAGTYQVKLRYKTNATRGQHTVSIDGAQVGGTIDQYATTSTFPEPTLGTVTFASSGVHTVRLAVTGKNAASSNFILSVDSITFVGQ